ncbi:MAG: hypothetical protein K2N63_00815 [Lachnospiraceae bacterium]|nr:hypothetical protein [Lachnospiraceae bacterium]
MKRLKILFLQFRLNLVLNTFFIAECVLVFLVVNSSISTLLYNGYLGKYAEFSSERTFFLSGAVTHNTVQGEPEEFERLVEEIRLIDGVSGVGYQMSESFLSGENEDLIVNGFVLNRDMLQIKYPLSFGEWFGSRDSLETQVILGGGIASLYKTGEIITLHKLEVVQGTLQYVPITARVIGKMRDPAFAVNLNFSSNRPDYVNMFEPYQNIILTDDPALISKDDIRYPVMSLLVFAAPDADLSKVRQELTSFGQPFDFCEVDGFYQEGMASRLARQIPTVGIMIFGILFGVMGITYLGVYQNMKTLSVYYLYGMGRRECALVSVILNTVMLVISLALSILLYFVPSIHDILFQRALLGPQNYIFSLAFIAVAALLSFAVSCCFSRKSPVTTLRRFE